MACNKCGSSILTLTCSRCESTRYCSIECARPDWDVHKLVCHKPIHIYTPILAKDLEPITKHFTLIQAYAKLRPNSNKLNSFYITILSKNEKLKLPAIVPPLEKKERLYWIWTYCSNHESIPQEWPETEITVVYKHRDVAGMKITDPNTGKVLIDVSNCSFAGRYTFPVNTPYSNIPLTAVLYFAEHFQLEKMHFFDSTRDPDKRKLLYRPLV